MSKKAAPRGAAFFLLLLLLAGVALGDDLADSRRFYQQALAAYEKQDHRAFLENVRAASALRPQHPTLLVRYAAALALNGQREAALANLERVAAMGMVYAVAEEKDFASLRGQPRFDAVVKAFAANAQPIGTAREEARIEELGLIPEGLAYDAKSRRLLVSSVRHRKILAVDAKKNVTTLVKDLPWGVFGMAVDDARGVLWATTTALPQVEGFRAEDKGKSALLRIDLKTGKLLGTLAAPGEHHFGDVTVAADGAVYVSDGASPAIYTVRGDALEIFLRGPFASLQGLTADAGVLYVADYSKGLYAIDRRTRDLRLLSVPRTASLLGVDGLYLAGPRTLVATQNGTHPNRILRIRLMPSGLGVAAVDTLLANAPGLGDPTLGVVIDKRFFFNGNAQWELFREDGTIVDPLKLAEAVVLSVSVP